MGVRGEAIIVPGPMRTGWMVIAAEGAINQPLSRDGERHADGVTAAEDERNSRLSHSRDELCDGEAGFDVAADRIEQYEQAVDLVGLLNRGDLGIMCSYLVVLVCWGASMWPSIWPTMVTEWMTPRRVRAVTEPV